MANARKPATDQPDRPLKRGWTTGACATAATKAAWHALLGGDFPDPVTIRLPRGQTPAFALARTAAGDDWRSATIIKDAGDDPDVTHGAEISATVRHLAKSAGIVFRAGEGIGTVTRAGLPVPPGEPAINPIPRRMMTAVIKEVAGARGVSADSQDAQTGPSQGNSPPNAARVRSPGVYLPGLAQDLCARGFTRVRDRGPQHLSPCP